MITEIAEKDKEAFKWLAQHPAATWSLSLFRANSKSDILDNNISESWNAVLKPARQLPILEMMEMIRLSVMKWLHIKRDEMKRHKMLFMSEDSTDIG